MSSATSSDNTKMSSAAAKSKKTAAAAAPAPAAPAPVAAAAPAPAKTTKKAAAKAAEVAAPAPAPVAAAPAAAAAPAKEENLGADLAKALADLQEQVAALKAGFSAISAGLKSAEKLGARLAKKGDRKRKRSKVEGAAPAPCIFTKPVKVTDELCSFLGVAKGTEVARSAVTKAVMDYAKSHNLMDKQTIKADGTLRKLLSLKESDTLNILNLQKFLSRHYVKAAPVAN
jgi:chromatin remodeling complex protein RSC6